MGADTSIAWCDHTFNPWIGCTKVSPLCTNCYAEVQTFARVQRGRGRELWGPTADRHRTSDSNWRQPLAWNAAAAAAGERHRVFCASLSDVFEDRRDLDPWRADLWKLIDQTPSLDWLLLTKRPQNVRRLAPEETLRRCWVGYSGADYRGIGWLLDVPAAVRFLSLEPLIEPIDLTRITAIAPEPPYGPGVYLDALRGHVIGPDDMLPTRLSWVIVGGESGHGARPCDVAWIRAIVTQCDAAGVPVFVKQLGSAPAMSDASWREAEPTPVIRRAINDTVFLALKDNKGGNPVEWPDDLRVREFPREVRS